MKLVAKLLQKKKTLFKINLKIEKHLYVGVQHIIFEFIKHLL